MAALLCAGLAMLGLLLALLAVWVGTGLLDGFDYRGTSRIAGRFLNNLPWMLPLAATGGILLYAYYDAALAERHKGWITLIAVVRLFALFPFLGFAILGSLMFAFAASIPLALVRRLIPRQPARNERPLMDRAMGTPLWVLTAPFSLLKIESEGDVEIPARIPETRLLGWLPILFLMLLLGPGFESESTGERVDPNWLAAIATYWLADYLIVTCYVAPALAVRARALRLARLGR
jgi:hypothetical protein